jgi:transcriptional regulator of acetoin/glycerol metabolism
LTASSWRRGSSYAEEFAGTNGIGTALESGQAAHVSGHEHYAGQLVDLACTAVPIRHPVSGLRINEGEAHAQDIDLRSR